jgi:hypothetical protein
MHIVRKKEVSILGRLIIDGNSVYEVDEECLKKGKLPFGCQVEEAIRRQEQREKAGERNDKNRKS